MLKSTAGPTATTDRTARRASTYALLLGLLAASSVLPAQPGTPSGAREVQAPAEQANRFLRSPEAMADLTFEMEEREGWKISGLQLGVFNSGLVVTSFISETPDGDAGLIDKTYSVDAFVTDTTELPETVFQTIGRHIYEVRAFTFGRTEDGRGYVDWAHLIAPDGAVVVNSFDPPPAEQGTVINSRGVTPQLACLDLCSGDCQIEGKDPCGCDGWFGGCLVDFDVPLSQ